MKHWQPCELKILASLRARFLEGTAGNADYWRSPEELSLYDETFAARIGWKIDAVIRGLNRLGWRPQSKRIVDWGCGTGIASRSVLAEWPDFVEVGLHDRSSSAMRFARERIAALHPHVRFGQPTTDADTLLVVSHVVNELPPAARTTLIEAAHQAGEVLWVEAGTHTDSRSLIDVRTQLLAGPNPPRVVTPCTHSQACGLLVPENARHWCHHFAEAPSGVFQNARWAEWSRELGIDLRALPYSHLVLTRQAGPETGGRSRIIGYPREGKNFCHVLSCQADGVAEFMLQKRDAPALYKTFGKEREYPPYRWTVQNGRIIAGEALGEVQE